MYERGLLEMYKAWTAKRLENNVDANVLNFFETNPTDEQIMLVSKINRAKGQWGLIWVLIIFFLGLVLGILLEVGTST